MTVLTSIDEEILNAECGVPGAVEDQVLHLARLTEGAGLDGIVCSVMTYPSTGRVQKGANSFGLISPTLERGLGQIEDKLILDQSVSGEVLSEYATLVRIAYHTSRDAGSGGLSETTWSSEEGTILSRHVDGERFLVLLGGPTLRTSLARYVLRQAAKRMREQS